MKILIISHNSFSTHQSMGKTFLSLFSSFKQEEICQIYIYPTIPDMDVCNSYYRITDKEVLKGICRLNKVGREIKPSEIRTNEHQLYENAKDENLYKNIKNSGSTRRILRDVIWKISKWYTAELKEWISLQKPTCIFLAPGYAKFIYDIALKISNDYDIPIISYICDDYYFVKQPQKIVDKIQLFLLKNKIEDLMKKSKHIVAISPAIERNYVNKFGVSSTTIMTGSSFEVRNEVDNKDAVMKISYFGNIRCNRYKSIISLAEELERINIRYNKKYSINLYTAEKNLNIISELKKTSIICINDFVYGETFKKLLHDSEVLLHVEAFDEDSIDLVKNSISTKIADCMASGVPTFAYGPEQVASIKYLKENECAFVATSKEEIENVLIKQLCNEELRKKVVEKAKMMATQNHNCEKNSYILKELMKRYTYE